MPTKYGRCPVIGIHLLKLMLTSDQQYIDCTLDDSPNLRVQMNSFPSIFPPKFVVVFRYIEDFCPSWIRLIYTNLPAQSPCTFQLTTCIISCSSRQTSIIRGSLELHILFNFQAVPTIFVCNAYIS